MKKICVTHGLKIMFQFRTWVLSGDYIFKRSLCANKASKSFKWKSLWCCSWFKKNSKTFGKSYSLELSGENGLALYIPEGFAHGFQALEDKTVLSYKCSRLYNPQSESGILWNDPILNIDWPLRSNAICSLKDQKLLSMKEFWSEGFYHRGIELYGLSYRSSFLWIEHQKHFSFWRFDKKAVWLFSSRKTKARLFLCSKLDWRSAFWVKKI